MRRFLSLLFLLTLLLAACGPANSDEDDEPIPGLDVTPTPAASNATAVPQGGVTISFAAWEGEMPLYEQMAAKFHEENPDINVVIVPMDDLMNPDPNAPQDPVSQLRRLVSGADTAPSYYVAPEAMKANLLLDMAPLMDADASFKRDDFYPGVLERATYSNGTFILPRFIFTQILYYNKDLFKASDLPEPTVGWTWQDLLGAAQQVANSDSSAYGFFDYSGGFTALISEIDRRGLKVLSTPPADVDLTDPELVATLESVKEMLGNRVMLSSNYREGDPDPQQIIRDGRVAIFPGEMFMSPPKGIEGGPEPLAFEVGKVPYPQLAGPYGNNTSVEGFVISAGTQHPNESWKWIEFLSRQSLSQEGMPGPGGYETSPGRIPARATLAEAIGYWDSLDEEAQAAYRAALAQPVTQMTSTPDYTVFGPLSQAVYEVTNADKDPKEALQSAQTMLEDQLAQMGQLTPTPEPETGPVVVATPVPQTAPEGAAVVTFDATGYQTSAFRRLARAFNDQNNGFFVQIKTTQTMTMPVTLADLSKTSDCFAWWGTPQSADDFKALLDLRPLFDGDASFKRDDFPAAVLGQFESNSGIYGLPYSFNVRNLSYNKTMFDAAGVEAPTHNWTPDDFLAAAKALTNGTGNSKQYGYVPYGGGPQGDMFFFINQFGGQLATGSGSEARPNFSDPKVVQAIQWYIDLAKVHGVMPEFTIPYRPDDQYTDNSYELIQNGRAGMWLDYGYSQIASTGPEGQGGQASWEQGYAALPVGAAGLQTGDLWARGFFISAASEQQQGCWEWLKFVSNDVSNLNGELPARMSIAESEEFKTIANPGQVELYEAYSEALKRPSSINPGMNALYTATPFGIDTYWFNKAIDDTIKEGADLAEGLTKADELTKAHMDCVVETKKPATCAKQVDPDYNGYNTQDPDPNQPGFPMPAAG